jgi:hypothetical protein
MTWADSCVESRAVLRAEVNVLQDVLQAPEFLHFAPSSTLLSAGDAGLVQGACILATAILQMIGGT